MTNLGAALYQSGRYEETAALLKKALPVYRALYGDEHAEVATILNDLGRSSLMAGHPDEATPLLRQALAMHERLLGPTHDDLVPQLNSLAMIDAYNEHLSEAEAEIQRAERIARLPGHGVLLDQVLLNVADIALLQSQWDRVAAPLAESRRLLEAAHPVEKRPAEAWRYAVWETVNAEWLAHQGDVATARGKIVSAAPVLAKRFGPQGFYSLLVRRRGKFVEQQAPATRRKS
jgi:tetratricopeptide repeat protein